MGVFKQRGSSSDANSTKRTVIACRQCGKTVESWTYRPRQFCSLSCAARFNRGAASTDPSKRVTMTCAACGVAFERKRGTEIFDGLRPGGRARAGERFCGEIFHARPKDEPTLTSILSFTR